MRGLLVAFGVPNRVDHGTTHLVVGSLAGVEVVSGKIF